MRNGDVLLCLIFNAAVIFGLYLWQTRLLGQKLKRVKREIQELEDLVVAIVEEFGESVTETSTAPQLKTEPPVEPQKTTASKPAGRRRESDSPQPAKVKTKNGAVPSESVQVLTFDQQSLEASGSFQPSAAPTAPLATARPATKSSAQAPEVKQELIPPTRPKAKPKPKPKPKAKPKVKETITPDSTAVSAANPAARQVNPEPGPQSPAEFELPLTGAPESKRQMVLKLTQQGMEVPEIARQLQMGQGEIQLILGLNKKS